MNAVAVSFRPFEDRAPRTVGRSRAEPTWRRSTRSYCILPKSKMNTETTSVAVNPTLGEEHGATRDPRAREPTHFAFPHPPPCAVPRSGEEGGRRHRRKSNEQDMRTHFSFRSLMAACTALRVTSIGANTHHLVAPTTDLGSDRVERNPP